MAIIDINLESPADSEPQDQEVVIDAAGLTRLHNEAFGRASIDERGYGTLVHVDDPSFKFVVGEFEQGLFVKLGNNGVTTLTYVIGENGVFQHVSTGDRLSPPVDITDKSLEIALIGTLLQQGEYGGDLTQ